jgi:poly(hydroxyalkanoate) depolymerase family esterase
MIRVLRTFTLTLLLAGVAASVATADAFPGPGSYTHGTYTSNGDAYIYGMYVPSSYRSGQHVPLVVVIHGCNAPPDLWALSNGYDSLAEQHDFIVLYPDVDAADLAAFECWKAFWAPGLEGRDKGDAAAIAGMTRTVMSAMTIDPTRVYAIGMSSGAFETSVLGAEYPDLYAAIGIHSGAAFMHGENGCFVTYAPTFSTDSLASDAYTTEGPRARLVPVILFHGDSDHAVPYQCGQQALAQWLQTDNDVLSAANAPTIPTAPEATMNGQVSGGYRYTVDSYQEPGRCTIAQFWTIHGMDHYWSGGSSDPTSYASGSDPKGPSASAASWAFFSAHRLTPPGAASPCVNMSRSNRHKPRTKHKHARAGCKNGAGHARCVKRRRHAKA